MRNNDYQKDLEFIRSHLEKMEKPEPSYNFFEETRNLCHSKLPSIKSPRVPKSVWIAFALNVILIGLLMIPLVKALKAGLPLSPPALSALILLIQNAVMLFFAPIILKKFKAKQKTGSHALVT